MACPVPSRAPGAPSLSGRLRVRVLPGSRAFECYGRETVEEEYFCNYEINPAFRDQIEVGGLRVSGIGEMGEVRIVERPDHPFFVGSLFLPQLTSTPGRPHPLIAAYLRAAASADVAA